MEPKALAPLALAFLVSVVLAHGANAQCTIGLYAEAAGENGALEAPAEFTSFSFYLVMFAEDRVKAVSYAIEVVPLRNDLLITTEFYGPGGGGINIASPGGSNVGLGVCATGFGGAPVLVTRFDGFLIPGGRAGGPSRERSPILLVEVGVRANPDESAASPVYAGCDNQIRPCAPGADLVIASGIIQSEAESFGAIKSLYGG